MNTKGIIAGCVVLSLLWSVGLAAPPLADKVPADAMLYVGWAGRSLTFDGSMFGQLLAEPGLKQALAAVKQAAQTQLKREPAALDTFESLWSMGGIAWRHPAALALYDVALPAGGRGGQPAPSGALLIDLQKDRAAFDAQLQKLLPVLGTHVKLSDKTVGNLSYKSFPTPVGPCSMGFVGNIFFMAVGEATPGKIAALADGKAKPLSTAPAFTAAMKEVCGEHVQIAYYGDVARALEMVDKLVELAGGPGGKPPVAKIIKALGFEGVTAVAGATTIVDRGMHEKCRIFSPAPHRGLLMLLAGKPLGAKALDGVPADADLVAAINISPADVLAEVKRVAAAIEPRAAKQLEAVLAGAGDTIGLDIEKDLLAHVGDQWTLISAPSLGGTLTGTVLVVELKDAKKFSASLAKVEALVRKMLGGPGGGAGPVGPDRPLRPFWAGGRGPKAVIRAYKSGEIEVHYLQIAPGTPIPVAPAWAVHKGKLYVAAFPQVVIAAAGGTSEKPLAKSAAFVALRKRLSPRASALAYCNTPSLVRRFYGLVLAGGTAATNALGRFGPGIGPEMLPPLPKVEKYIWPDISAVSSDAKGITIESYGSLPSGMLFNITLPPPSPTVPALAASILVPSLQRARTLAKRALSARNLNGIGKGIVMYRVEHNDRFPPNLPNLIEEGTIPALMLYSQSSGRKPRLDSKGKPIGPIDYVYLGAELSPDAPPDLVIAYERPEINRGKGTNVLYVDGHVRWVSMEKFRRDLERTQEYIRKKGGT